MMAAKSIRGNGGRTCVGVLAVDDQNYALWIRSNRKYRPPERTCRFGLQPKVAQKRVLPLKTPLKPVDSRDKIPCANLWANSI